MKTIGILAGMTWQSSITYYREINAYIQEQLGGEHSAKILLYSVDFAEIEAIQRSGNWPEAGRILAEAGLKLKAGGADFILIAANTMHLVADDVIRATGLPFLHIAEVTADQLLADGIRTVALTGTKFTMEMPFYRDILQKRGLELIVPQEQQRDFIQNTIHEELGHGIIRQDSLHTFQAILQDLKSRGAEAVILGCTEIGLLIHDDNSPLKTYDTALIHAKAAARLALLEE
ncbi:MAG: aspartate/glutamate racemase family protein [Negativicutes bacterium]|nr:aspartate/glutamate racemase family protein [Negativicutes bacterium]